MVSRMFNSPPANPWTPHPVRILEIKQEIPDTATYELACAGVPMVIAYRMSALSFLVIRLMIKIKYASVVNIVLGREVAPEFIQGACRATDLKNAVLRLFRNGDARAAQHRDLAEIAQALGQGQAPSSRRVCDVILNLLEKKRRTG